MALPPILSERLKLPVVAAPLFIISTPDLVIAQCKAGVVGSFPALNARPAEELDRWLEKITTALTQGCLGALRRAGGSVVGLVDTSWGRSWDGLGHYTATKAGLRQLMLNLAGELAPHVRVNCVAPGAIMAADWEAEHFADVVEKVPLKRSGKAEDIAAAIHHLLEHNVLSGHVLHVDGGWSMVE